MCVSGVCGVYIRGVEGGGGVGVEMVKNGDEMVQRVR